jgi:hypothetical protein
MNSTRPQNGTTAAVQTIEVARPSPSSMVEIDPLAIIEQRNKMLEKVLDYAIRATHSGQWVNQNGKPWPMAAAAEVMARRCAVRVRDVKSKKLPSSDDKGPFYLYLVEATASLPGEWDSIEAMGTCSSRDQFLGTETGAGRALSEIDEGNILKAAYSNMLVNAVTRLLGVRNMTWERLAELGIDQGGAAKVEYRHGSQGGGGAAKPSGDLKVKFGRNKDKMLSECPDADIRWLIACWEKDLKDSSKSKFHANSQESIKIARAILESRSGAQKPAPSAPASSDSDEEASPFRDE